MRRQLVALGVVVSVVALTVLTAGALTLKRVGERALDRELTLQQVQEELRVQDGLAWRAGNAKVDLAGVTADLRASADRVDAALATARAQGLSATLTHQLRSLQGRYLGLAVREVGLISGGQQQAAAALGRDEVAPALQQLQAKVQSGVTTAHDQGTRARRDSSIGVLVLGASVLLLFAMVMLRMRSLEATRRREREALNHLQREFVASTSQDLRMPLTSILGYGEILVDDRDLDSTRRTAASAIVRNAQRLSAIADNLLFLSASDAGRRERIEGEVDLTAVLDGLRDQLATMTRTRALHAELVVPEEHVFVKGDPAELERIAINLLSNAVKFTPDGGEILCRLVVDGGNAVIEVHDTGMGISRADQQYLFTRFFRSRTVRERAIQGTGLGLSIVASIVDDHGGKVTVSSAEGVGSTFTVKLPLLRASVPA